MLVNYKSKNLAHTCEPRIEKPILMWVPVRLPPYLFSSLFHLSPEAKHKQATDPLVSFSNPFFLYDPKSNLLNQNQAMPDTTFL